MRRIGLILMFALTVVAACGGAGAEPSPSRHNPTGPSTVGACTPQAMRLDEGKSLSQGGGVIVYERNGGLSCVDELYAIYADGGITSDYGNNNTTHAQIAAAQVDTLLGQIGDLGFFTDSFYTTYHDPCPACHQYSTTVKYNGQTKTVGAVDGGESPSAYWQMTSYLAAILYPGTLSSETQVLPGSRSAGSAPTSTAPRPVNFAARRSSGSGSCFMRYDAARTRAVSSVG